jgi:hypothetical protein
VVFDRYNAIPSYRQGSNFVVISNFAYMINECYHIKSSLKNWNCFKIDTSLCFTVPLRLKKNDYLMKAEGMNGFCLFFCATYCMFLFLKVIADS